MKHRIAIVRGKFLNAYEMQFFEPLVSAFDITAFGSLSPYHDRFAFPVVKLPSPTDLPDFPFKMQILNRVFVDAQYLAGLEGRLRGFDLVHTAETYFSYTGQCLSARRKGYVRRVVATVLENIPFNNEGIWGRREAKRRAREELDHIIALTTRAKAALLLEGADERKITVIGHFVDIRRFSPNTKKAQHRGRGLNIVFCGRLERCKGVYELLYAFYLLTRDGDTKGNNVKLTYVGKGRERQGLEKKAKDLAIRERVAFSESSYEDMPEVYRSADIYAAPSLATQTWQEQYNTSLLEAQATGLPIVTTLTGGIPENIKDAGVLVQAGDVVSLKEALFSFVRSPRQRRFYGQKARKRAESVHDARIGADRLSALYQEILSR